MKLRRLRKYQQMKVRSGNVFYILKKEQLEDRLQNMEP